MRLGNGVVGCCVVVLLYTSFVVPPTNIATGVSYQRVFPRVGSSNSSVGSWLG